MGTGSPDLRRCTGRALPPDFPPYPHSSTNFPSPRNSTLLFKLIQKPIVVTREFSASVGLLHPSTKPINAAQSGNKVQFNAAMQMAAIRKYIQTSIEGRYYFGYTR